MKKSILLLFFLMFISTSVFAGRLVIFNNRNCPVDGRWTKSKYVKYNDIRYNFCSRKCIIKFKLDPEKHLKNLPNEGKIQYLNNLRCPVANEHAVDRNIVTYNGYKIRTCSLKCRKMVSHNAEKYLARMGIKK